MRHRSRGALVPFTTAFHNAGLRRVVHHDGSPDSYPDPPFNVVTEYAEQTAGFVEDIWDSVSSHHPWNDHPCIHETIHHLWQDTDQVRKPISHQIGAEHGSSDPSEWTELHCDWDCHAGRGFWISPDPIDPRSISFATNDSSLLGKEANAMADHVDNVLNPVREQISLANFILEIGDIKRSASTLIELISRLNPSNQILNYQLGVKPLIGDLKALMLLLLNLHKDLETVHRSRNQPVRITTSRNLSEVPLGPSAHVKPSYSDGTVTICQYDTPADEVTVKFVTWVKYDLSHLSDIELTVRGALRAIGAGNPIRVIWNAIPYTFVVDWVYNVSAMLKKFDIAKPEIPRSVFRQTSHLKMGRQIQLFTTVFDGPFSDRPIWDDYKVGTFQRTRYRRWVGLPPEWVQGYVPPGDPHLRELVLSILLGAQAAPHVAKVLHKFAFAPKGSYPGN